jgi:hypothetical protein
MKAAVISGRPPRLCYSDRVSSTGGIARECLATHCRSESTTARADRVGARFALVAGRVWPDLCGNRARLPLSHRHGDDSLPSITGKLDEPHSFEPNGRYDFSARASRSSRSAKPLEPGSQRSKLVRAAERPPSISSPSQHQHAIPPRPNAN